MGHKTKLGKRRKDKYYRLAKETGFRSRAAFKLLQLNRKFGFLEKSRVLVDLCAAPGGWMQVAQQNMPVSSVIVGVDLYPIKPVPGCIGLVEDITTDKCKASLTKALQSWKADVVLNDGAPNVGTNWLHDAYQQAELTLSALKLATELLREGGWFVTKIFRSKDYNPLLWVLKQLFKKVHATKPQASRNESAEIFVVCQHYKAPHKLDPKFLQPKHVFKELELDPANKLNFFHPEKQKKAKAEGYVEGDYTLFHSVRASEFVASENGIDVLQKASEIVLDDEEVARHPKTTAEIKECCKDIRVLGRKDLRLLMAWWKALRDDATAKAKAEEPKEEDKEEEETGEDEEERELRDMDQHVEDMKLEELREAKKKKRVADKERRKLDERMRLKMVLKGDQGPVVEGEPMFHLGLIGSRSQLDRVAEQPAEVVAESDAETDDEAQPKTAGYEKGGGRGLDASGRFYKEDGDSDEEEGEADGAESESDSLGSAREDLGLSEEESEGEAPPGQGAGPGPRKDNPLLTDLDFRARKEKRMSKVALWFEKDAFRELETEADEDFELDLVTEQLKKRGGKVVGQEEEAGAAGAAGEGQTDSETSDTESEGSDFDVEREMGKKKSKRAAKEEKALGFEVVPKEQGKKVRKRKLNEEGLALGTLMVSSKKKKRDLIDGAWNRFAFNDEHLPEWFAEDEKKHMRQEVQVPEEMAQEYRTRLREINDRPIKKVVEAKARKKRRTLKKLQKAKKKVEAIMDNADASEREKVRQIQKLYKKARPQRKELTYVVAKKHTATKRVRRPLGVKGPYRVVDPRMKKDNKQLKKTARGRKGGKGGKGGERSRRKKR